MYLPFEASSHDYRECLLNIHKGANISLEFASFLENLICSGSDWDLLTLVVCKGMFDWTFTNLKNK